MGPETWGPHGWKFIHFITMAYPSHPSKYDKKHYKDFFTNLSHVIPCSLCADNYKDHLRIYPLNDFVLNSRDNLMDWGVKMHNLVNQSNNKKIYSKEDAFKLIAEEDFRDKENCNIGRTKNNSFTKYFIIITLIIFGLILAFQFSKFYIEANSINNIEHL